MTNQLKLKLAFKISECLDRALGPEEIYSLLTVPPESKMGDLAFPCFTLAKIRRQSPVQVAESLRSSFPADSSYQSVQAFGPYLNFTFTAGILGQELISEWIRPRTFKSLLKDNSVKTMIEFSQPNTHKELHVGHMRNACLGDALVKMHRYLGHNIVSSTFPGDVGTHVAKCLWYLKYHNNEPIPIEDRGQWLGKMYSLAHIKLEDELDGPHESKNREQLTEILKQLEAKKGEFFDLWLETKQWSLELMKKVYEWAEISFDQWYWESDVDSASVEYVKKLFQENKLEKSSGAIGMNLEADKLGFCLLLKSDGTGLYATKDLELARRKFQDHNIQKNIYVVDVRQELHFKQVFKVLEKLGFPQAKDCYHLKYNFVELPDGPMSSRKGNIVPLMDLVQKMESMVKEKYLDRYQGEWTENEINLVARQVAQGAIKYGMLRMDTNKKIVFDMEEWLKIDGESGPFIQYSLARVNSLCKKLNWEVISKGPINWSVLNHPAERALMQTVLYFDDQVISATENHKPHLLCTFLYEAAKKFNYFYHECSIAQAESEEIKNARLALSAAIRNILTSGLRLLGIPAPERM